MSSASRRQWRGNGASQLAAFRPNVIGDACWPCVLPAMTVFLWRSARAINASIASFSRSSISAVARRIARIAAVSTMSWLVGAAMDEPGVVQARRVAQLANQFDGRHPRRGHAAADRGGVNLERGGCGGDRVRRGRWNDAHRRLGAGQRDFDRQQIGQALAIGEHGRDTVVDAKQISEQRRVEDGDHASKNTVSRSPCRRISQR